MTSEKILVTGASGYLAGHVVKLLQEAGHIVRGTVRSTKDDNKLKHLYDLCPNALHRLQLVEADLTKAETWEPAVSDMTYVIHVASPFPLQNPKNEDELIRPAVDGTLSILKACAKSRTVRRVVLTSSCVTIDWIGQSHDKPRDESYWSDVTKQTHYLKSKTLAERAAWDFIKELPDQDKFQLAVINPTLIMGPPLQGSPCSSVEMMKQLLERATPMVPNCHFAIVDVRDAAEAHVRAMTLPQAAGHRHICNTQSVWFPEMCILLKAVFGPQGYNVPTKIAPKAVLRIAKLFDSRVRTLYPEIGVVHLYDNRRMREVLKIQPREIRDTVIEMAYSLIEAGVVKKTSKYRGPGGPEEREMYMKILLS